MEKLAAASDIKLRTLQRFERSSGTPRPATVAAIRNALQTAGVEFIPENGGGAGVRLREPTAGPITPTEADEVR